VTSPADAPYRRWKVLRTVELGAPREVVWEVIGGFYTIHLWHPDIELTEIPDEQTTTRQLRRELTFPGQPKTVEELLWMNTDAAAYGYKWHSGQWGEEVRNYHAVLRVFSGDRDRSSTAQWSSEFDYPTDAISKFYLNGFVALRQRFPKADLE
jgi:Polyketide cyclase / dehydrase and lipid transport